MLWFKFVFGFGKNFQTSLRGGKSYLEIPGSGSIFKMFSVNAGPDNGFSSKVYNIVFVPWVQAF